MITVMLIIVLVVSVRLYHAYFNHEPDTSAFKRKSGTSGTSDNKSRGQNTNKRSASFIQKSAHVLQSSINQVAVNKAENGIFDLEEEEERTVSIYQGPGT
eukprot:Pgem_evm1s13638